MVQAHWEQIECCAGIKKLDQLFLGEATVLWRKNENSYLFAGQTKIRQDLRIDLVDSTNLHLDSANLDYAGKAKMQGINSVVKFIINFKLHL